MHERCRFIFKCVNVYPAEKSGLSYIRKILKGILFERCLFQDFLLDFQ